MKKNLFLLPLFALLAFTASEFSLLHSVPGPATFFTTDNLGNAYLIKKNVLEKYDRNGKLMSSFSDKQMDEITLVDASNPLKILVYNKNFSSLFFLDNTLSQNGEPLQLRQLGLSDIRLVCTSHDNGLWIYDEQNSELLRVEKPFDKTQRTGNLVQTLGYKPNPTFLTEYNNLLYLNNPETGILVFDVFGTYYKTIPLKNIPAFQLNGNSILYFQNGKIKSYNTKLLQEGESILPDSSARSARIENERLYLLQNNAFEFYSVK